MHTSENNKQESDAVVVLSGKTITLANIALATAFFLRITIVIAMFIAGIKGEWVVLFVSLLSLISTFLPSLLAKNFHVNLPVEFEFVITLFLYSTIFLGGAGGFYDKFWWWDLVVHAGSGIGLGFIGFLILYTLFTQARLKMSPFLLSVFSFTFAMAFGATWEIFEFAMDSFFGMNMQRTGLADTMGDLIVDSVGALFTSVIGYIYVIRCHCNGKPGFFDYAIRKFYLTNPHFSARERHSKSS